MFKLERHIISFSAYFHKILFAFTLIVFLVCGKITEGQQATFYVSPNGNNPECTIGAPGSLEMAQKKVRELNQNMTGDILVYLSGGYYTLSKTFELTNLDGGTDGHFVSYCSLPNEKPIISGAIRIIDTNWIPVGNGIYKHYAGDYNFRQLYVNSNRAIRARTPNKKDESTKGPYYKVFSFNENEKTVSVNASEIGNWNNLTYVEMITQQHWYQNTLRIESYSVSGNIAKITPQSTSRDILFEIQDYLRSSTAGNSYHFENALEFLDSEGEWYLDTEASPHQIYYKIRPGEDPANLEVEIPNLETIMNIIGTSSENVKNIRFEGIQFRGSNWIFPTTNKGMIATQGVQIRNLAKSYDKWPAIINVEYAQNVVFNKNIISSAGCNGIMFSKGVKNSKIVNNEVNDISANGIVIDFPRKNNPSTTDGCTNNIISNNLIESYGIQYTNGIGIIAGFIKNHLIEHNEIRNGTYMGMQVGNQQTDDFQGTYCNKIRYNNIHHVMQLHEDGGGIYTLGNQPKTHIFENWLHDLAKSSYAGSYNVNAVYLDNHSAYITVENNVFSNFSSEVVEIYEQSQSGSPSHDNYLINNDTQDQNVKDNAGLIANYIVPDLSECNCENLVKQGVNEAELMEITGYVLEENGLYANGQGLKCPEGICDVTSTFDGEPGDYQIVIHFADENDGISKYALFVNGVQTDTWEGSDSPVDWAEMRTHVSPQIELKKGDVIRLTGQKDSGEFARLDYIDIVSQIKYELCECKIPGKIEAEFYDVGGEGVAYHDVDDGNHDSCNREDNVDIQTGSDTDASCYVGWISDGEWLEYSLSSVDEGNYDINIRLASGMSNPGELQIKINDSIIGVLDVENTEGGQTYVTKTISNIELKDIKKAILRLQSIGGGFNLNWVEFKKKIGTSATDKFDAKKWKIYPNPCDNSLNLFFSQKIDGKLNVRILNVLGEIIEQKHTSSGDGSIIVNTSAYKPGIYILSIHSSEETFNAKIIKN